MWNPVAEKGWWLTEVEPEGQWCQWDDGAQWRPGSQEPRQTRWVRGLRWSHALWDWKRRQGVLWPWGSWQLEISKHIWPIGIFSRQRRQGRWLAETEKKGVGGWRWGVGCRRRPGQNQRGIQESKESWAGPAGPEAKSPSHLNSQMFQRPAVSSPWVVGVWTWSPRELPQQYTVLPAHAPGQTCLEALAPGRWSTLLLLFAIACQSWSALAHCLRWAWADTLYSVILMVAGLWNHLLNLTW